MRSCCGSPERCHAQSVPWCTQKRGPLHGGVFRDIPANSTEPSAPGKTPARYSAPHEPERRLPTEKVTSDDRGRSCASTRRSLPKVYRPRRAAMQSPDASGPATLASRRPERKSDVPGVLQLCRNRPARSLAKSREIRRGERLVACVRYSALSHWPQVSR